MESKYAHLFIKYGEQYGVPPELLEAQAFRESAYDPNAIGGSGEVGISQFMPSTWDDFGCEGEMTNPDDSIKCQARFMKAMSEKWVGDPKQTELTLSSYNAGYGATSRAGGIPNNGHTPGYVRDIMAGYNRRLATSPTQLREPVSGLGSIYRDGVVWHHEAAKGFHENARDISVGCDEPLVSPVNGVLRRYKETDHHRGHWNTNFDDPLKRDNRKMDRDVFGNTIIEVEGEGYFIMILHAEWVDDLNSGDTVTRGQVIGYEDSIGNSSQCHAHVKVMKGTDVIDPYRVE